MARRRNDPGGVIPLPFDGSSKNEWIRASLEAFARSAAPGTLFPSERVLAEQFGVARMTVRGALDALESATLIRRVPGRGAFVQRPLVTQSEVLRSFTEDMRLRGMVPGTGPGRSERRTADAYLAERLEISEGDPVFFFERVRTADGEPMALERTNVPAERFPGLLDRIHDDESLYDVLSSSYGVVVDSAEQTVAIAQLTSSDARSLGTDPGAPSFALARTSRDRMGTVVEWGRSLYRGDRYVIQMHVAKEPSSG
ncbi:GntR family transcriptional regulator [Microbacterium resistens]|uniref:GntR family transcriptional regulator n=1 Tax=Microbacterium resistens TaxID=156977 RepID=UPI001C56703D|nr:GntR family transcriptional regulator [Microbacterium resistens]MBW1639597.1 GntR family transcriptional regulator [Microbacterium resistens]